MSVAEDDLLRYYWQELQYLRRLGSEYARAHPKVASRLELEADVCPDPHVERLIEAFAFLTGRIQYNLDQDFPEIATELLGVLYPHFLHPVPPLTIARFEPDTAEGKLLSGYTVPQHTPLFAHALSEERETSSNPSRQVCRFRTCYPVELWPLEVMAASFEPPDRYTFLDRRPEVATVLRLSVRGCGAEPRELETDRLRFHLAGDQILVGALYELLFNHLLQVAVQADDATEPRMLPASILSAVGFAEDQGLLPAPTHAQPAYRLLQEYFVFPEKFHFFELAGLAPLEGRQQFDLLFLLEHVPQRPLAVTAETFQLGCTPIVNLFERTSEPIRVDHRSLDYRLVADRRREATVEVHSIREVYGVDGDGNRRGYAPYYSYDHQRETTGQACFWHARRQPTLYRGAAGTELRLAFLDLGFHPSQPPSETVYARTLCSNRSLAEQVPAGAVLRTELALPPVRISVLKKPTRCLHPPLRGDSLWRLISHLSLNYLSLSEGQQSLKALREILRLYAFSDAASVEQQILGIRRLEHRRTVARLGADAWRGFVRGTEITLTFDEKLYVGSSAYLLSAVLHRFFGLYASTNSFTQLRVLSEQREGEWTRWPPMAGAKPLP